MKPEFSLAYPVTLSHEGKWDWDKDDPGGQTLLGTTRRDWSWLSMWADHVDPWLLHGAPSVPNPWEVSEAKDQCKFAAEKGYWTRLRCGELLNHSLAAQAFDTAFNVGVHTAGRLFQEALNYMNRDYPGGLNLYRELATDGGLGKVTLAALTKILDRREGDILFGHYQGLRIGYYQTLMVKSHVREKYQGWIRRAQEFHWQE